MRGERTDVVVMTVGQHDNVLSRTARVYGSVIVVCDSYCLEELPKALNGDLFVVCRPSAPGVHNHDSVGVWYDLGVYDGLFTINI